MRIMWRILYHQAKAFEHAAVLGAGGHDIDTCCIDAAVAQNVRQFGNILFYAVKCAGEQISQIMGKYLCFLYPCHLAQPLHLSPNAAAYNRLL